MRPLSPKASFLGRILLAGAMLAAAPAHADIFTLQGSTTLSSRLMIPQKKAIEAASGHKLVLVPNKSSLGLQALFEGTAQFAMISGPLDTEVQTLQTVLPNAPFDRLKVFQIARVQMAFAVHPDNPLRTITRDKLRSILQGKIKTWREVGGSDLPIQLVMVREGGGVQASVENTLLEGGKIDAGDAIHVQISSQVVKIVLQVPGALGLAQAGIVRRAEAPELALDEPIEQRLSLVVLGEPTPEMKSVIDATSDVAAKVLE
ncbi:phosphate ABC transporter substrate-binding protein [Rhodoplanes sp. Z2-YC6860]|nr:phosphate ABC transporter substrate-binding protein [Rhodoplanes sp. Z2-YC6860]